MRIHLLKTNWPVTLIHTFILVLVVLLMVFVYLFLCLYRSDRVSNVFSQSKEPWICKEEDFSFTIYNMGNLTDECRDYIFGLEQKGIELGVDDGIGILRYQNETNYYHFQFIEAGSVFSAPVTLFSYDDFETYTDHALQEDRNYIHRHYFMQMFIKGDKFKLILDNDTVEGADDVMFHLLGEKACFTKEK